MVSHRPAGLRNDTGSGHLRGRGLMLLRCVLLRERVRLRVAHFLHAFLKWTLVFQESWIDDAASYFHKNAGATAERAWAERGIAGAQEANN